MELILNGQTYASSGKLDAFSQLHVARKLGPALPIVDGLVKVSNAEKDKTILTVLMLSHISDADTEFVVRKCLSVVVRNQGGKAAKIQAPDGTLMFDDIDMMGLIQLTTVVIEENLGSFFRDALASLGNQPESQ